MSSTSVLFDKEGDVARVTLNEPERMNPLSESLLDGLRDALQRVQSEPGIRALLLTAQGRGFCSGADLKEFHQRASELSAGDSLGQYVGRLMAERANPVIQALRDLPVPVVCAVNGMAAGGGVGLALAGDVVIAARSAKFYLPFIPALGIVPDMGASWHLPRALGRARAMGLTLSGHKLSAEQAAAWGLIWEAVDDDALLAHALQWARQLAALPAHAIAEARALYQSAETNTFEQQLALERQRQMTLIDEDSFAEGLTAFAERRQPVFRGR